MRSVGEIWSVEVPEGALESGLRRGCTYVVKCGGCCCGGGCSGGSGGGGGEGSDGELGPVETVSDRGGDGRGGSDGCGDGCAAAVLSMAEEMLLKC